MIPLFTRRPDGTLMIEVSLDDLQKEWVTTPHKNKLMLQGGRPAIRRPGDALDPSDSIVTVHQAMWDRVKFKVGAVENWNRNLAQQQSAKLCVDCGHELKVVEEQEQVWQMKCPVCEMPQVWGKNLIGGTIGSGKREKK